MSDTPRTDAFTKDDPSWGAEYFDKLDEAITLCRTLERELGEALRLKKAAQDALEYNLGIANRTNRSIQAERDGMIRTLRASYSAIEIAKMVGLTRQRVHQILNEPTDVNSTP